MKNIWPDGTVEEIPDEVPAFIKAHVDFWCWFESLTAQDQEKTRKLLNDPALRTTGIPDQAHEEVPDPNVPGS